MRWLAALGLFATFWVFLAPASIGGKTSYTVTDGASMLPRLQAGDLALVRTRSSYRVGDVILYRAAHSGQPVLHRIVAIRAGKYFFKGDSNTFVDPAPVGRSALVGGLWFHVPRLGGWAGWLATPVHSALFAGGAALVLVLGHRTARHRRRERRGGVDPPRAPALAALRGVDLASRVLPAAGIAVLAAAILAVGFSRPLQRTVSAPAYHHSGDFSYSGRLATPSPAYPSGYAVTSQPLLLDLVDRLNLRFNYAFTSRRPHEIHGTIALATVASAATSWHQTVALGKPVRFDGDSTHVRGAIDLGEARSFFDRLSMQAGSVGADYDIELRATVRIAGIVDGKAIRETFTPSLPFTFNHQLMRLRASEAPRLPGSSSALHPVQAGAISRQAGNVVAIARLQLDVARVRLAGISLGALALVLLLRAMVTRHRPRSEHELIQRRYGHLMIPAAILDRERSRAVELPDFRSLARLATHYEHLILHEQNGDRHTYAVEEDRHLYVYRIEPSRPQLDTRAHPSPRRGSAVPLARRGGTARRRPAARRRRLLFPLGLGLALSVCATLVGSVTASNTVPATRAGAKTQARTLSELRPALCSSLTLTNLVVMPAGATTVAGTSANDLILGRARNGGVTYNGAGGSDCIVAGAGTGTKRLNGGPGADICIGSITGANIFSSCATTYN